MRSPAAPGVRIATTSDIGHWFRNDRVTRSAADDRRREGNKECGARSGGPMWASAPTEGYEECGRAGRCGERTERCQWQRERSERVAAVKILSVRRKAAQKFWAPQQDHRPLRRGLHEVRQNGPSGKSAKRCRWQKKRGGFEEVPRLADTTVAGNRLARRWATAGPYEILRFGIFSGENFLRQGDSVISRLFSSRLPSTMGETKEGIA